MDSNGGFRPPWHEPTIVPWERKGALQLPPLQVSTKERRRARLRKLRSDKRVILSTVLTFLLGTGGIVASYANYSATATNGAAPANAFSTGSVTIADDESGSAMFNFVNIDPPQTYSSCIAVQYTGTVALGSYIYLYDTISGETNSLGASITMAVQDGTDTQTYAAGDTNCSHFTANGTVNAASHASTGTSVTALALDSWPTADATGYSLSNSGSGAGVQAWTANPTTVWYKFTATVPNGSPASSAVDVEYTWEADGQ